MREIESKFEEKYNFLSLVGAIGGKNLILSCRLMKMFAPATITTRIFTPLYFLLLLAQFINISTHLLKQREVFQTVVY